MGGPGDMFIYKLYPLPEHIYMNLNQNPWVAVLSIVFHCTIMYFLSRESMMDDFEETELLIMQDEAMRVSLL